MGGYLRKRIQTNARRQMLFTQQDGRCAFCGRPLTLDQNKVGTPEYATMDHLIPRATGGKDEPTNLVLACAPCNQEKRDLPLIVFLIRRAATG